MRKESDFKLLRYWLDKHWREASSITIQLAMYLYETISFYLRDAPGLAVIGLGTSLLALMYRHRFDGKPKRIARLVVLNVPRAWVCGAFAAELIRRLEATVWLTVPLILFLLWVIHLLDPKPEIMPEPVGEQVFTLLAGLCVDARLIRAPGADAVVADVQIGGGSADGIRIFIVDRYTRVIRELDRHGSLFIGRFWIHGEFFVELRRDINLTEKRTFTVKLRPAEVPPPSQTEQRYLQTLPQRQKTDAHSVRVPLRDVSPKKKKADTEPPKGDVYC